MIQDLLKRIQELDNRIRQTGSVTWYRGHRRSEWPLKSSLHRHIERITEGVKDVTPEDLQELLGCRVDLVTEDGLKARLRERVLREAVPL